MKCACIVLPLLLACSSLAAQTTTAPPNQRPDERYKADILVLVAHPDDETAIFSYLAKAVLDFEPLLEGLQPWQAKKLYYFTDSLWLDLRGKATEFSNQEVSPSRKVSYERLAAEEASFHLSQEDNKPFADAAARGQLEEYLRHAKATLGFAVFPNPVRLLPIKSHVKVSATSQVFEGVGKGVIPFAPPRRFVPVERSGVSVELGGAWAFYRDFWRAHDLEVLGLIVEPRIHIAAGRTLQVPLLLRNDTDESQDLTLLLKAALPEGWIEAKHPSHFTVEAGDLYPVQVEIATPETPSDEWREIHYAIEVNGREVSRSTLKVQLRDIAIPQ
jgi:hypothetical protein